jgi:hypothetical protein
VVRYIDVLLNSLLKKVVDCLFARIANKFRCWKKCYFQAFSFIFGADSFRAKENKQISRVHANKNSSRVSHGAWRVKK